ncbi:lipoprotein-releasing system ATP-binding protein LolD [archaeon]|nr:lipoprotein-releasing system ATP-binding protein LolD [archaeon]
MLVTEALTKTYQIGEVKVHALNNVDLEIKKGEFVAIMGPSGSGKSTLLHLLGGLDKPTGGRVLIDGQDMTEMTEDQLAEIRSEKIGFVFQLHNLLPSLTAVENVELPMIFSESGAKIDRKKKATELLKTIGLGDRLNHTPLQLSGGQQQMVAIARALANAPSILFTDEPTGELDTKSGNEILNLLKNLNKEKNITLILVTHDPDVAQHADRIIYMRDGKIFNREVDE